MNIPVLTHLHSTPHICKVNCVSRGLPVANWGYSGQRGGSRLTGQNLGLQNIVSKCGQEQSYQLSATDLETKLADDLAVLARLLRSSR